MSQPKEARKGTWFCKLKQEKRNQLAFQDGMMSAKKTSALFVMEWVVVWVMIFNGMDGILDLLTLDRLSKLQAAWVSTSLCIQCILNSFWQKKPWETWNFKGPDWCPAVSWSQWTSAVLNSSFHLPNLKTSIFRWFISHYKPKMKDSELLSHHQKKPPLLFVFFGLSSFSTYLVFRVSSCLECLLAVFDELNGHSRQWTSWQWQTREIPKWQRESEMSQIQNLEFAKKLQIQNEIQETHVYLKRGTIQTHFLNRSFIIWRKLPLCLFLWIPKCFCFGLSWLLSMKSVPFLTNLNEFFSFSSFWFSCFSEIRSFNVCFKVNQANVCFLSNSHLFLGPVDPFLRLSSTSIGWKECSFSMSLLGFPFPFEFVSVGPKESPFSIFNDRGTNEIKWKYPSWLLFFHSPSYLFPLAQ